MLSDEPVDPFGPTRVEISGDLLKRRVFWDVVPDSIAIASIIRSGQNSASPDVEKWEKDDSDRRRARISHLDPILNVLVDHVVEALRNAMLVTHGESVLENRFYNEDSLRPLISAGVTGVLSELTDFDYVRVGDQQ